MLQEAHPAMGDFFLDGPRLPNNEHDPDADRQTALGVPGKDDVMFVLEEWKRKYGGMTNPPDHFQIEHDQ